MEVLSCHPNLVEMKDVVNARYSTSGICVDSVGKILLDEKQSLAARFRVLFILRNLKCDASVRYIARCFADSSALLKHELAYCLGQMCNPAAVPYLTAVLEDKTQEPIVRHEAAEALGAIGQNSSLAVLEKYVNDEEREVAETCQLAVNRIKWVSEKNASADDSAFDSIDPAPAYSATASTVATDVESLRNVLVDETLPLWDRYRAMFSLRNLYIDDERAVKALASGLKCAQSGALFRHEVAYVLGQIQSPASVEELAESLRDVDESPMVRHECAEALGSIATPECMNIVRSFASDDERIVRESCEVALDMAEYKQSNEFQYAKIE